MAQPDFAPFLGFVLGQERNMAAIKIQLVVRKYLQKCRAKRQNQAAFVIQSVWRGYVARNQLRLQKEAQLRARQHEAATVIQVSELYILYVLMRLNPNTSDRPVHDK